MIPTNAPGFLSAFAAGLLSFASPCVLPLIPVYLSFISGESVRGKETDSGKKMVLFYRTLLFVAGFSIVFVLLAVIFGGGMRFLGSSAHTWISRVSGLLVILLGINIMFDLIPVLRREVRIQASTHRATPLLLGMAFGAGWTPCIGPILSTILLFAGQAGEVPRAALLLTMYSAGFGLPFIIASLFFDRMQPLFSWLKRHGSAVKIVSGVLLISFGLVMLAGNLTQVTVFFLKAGYAMEELSQTGPQWFKPLASFLSRWLLFQGI